MLWSSCLLVSPFMFLVYLTTLFICFGYIAGIGNIIVSNKLGTVWNEAAAVDFNLFLQHLPGRSVGNHVKHPQVDNRTRDTERRLPMSITPALYSGGLWFKFRLGDGASELRCFSIFFISFKLDRNRFSRHLLEFIIHWKSFHIICTICRGS